MRVVPPRDCVSSVKTDLTKPSANMVGGRGLYGSFDTLSQLVDRLGILGWTYSRERMTPSESAYERSHAAAVERRVSNTRNTRAPPRTPFVMEGLEPRLNAMPPSRWSEILAELAGPGRVLQPEQNAAAAAPFDRPAGKNPVQDLG